MSASTPTEKNLNLPHPYTARWLCGDRDENLSFLSSALGVHVRLAGDGLVCTGPSEAVGLAAQLLTRLIPLASEHEILSLETLRGELRGLDEEAAAEDDLQEGLVTRTQRGKPVRARTLQQLDYVRAVTSHTLTFGLGPAGTGKTFLAVALASRWLREKRVGRVILTRPAVEAGENLGFLPGDLQAKVDPYFRPLYDALYEMFDGEKVTRYLERGMIEVAPLAYMRGRTLADAFIILDEAQNTTPEQMKMFLTRIGPGSRVVVTGDVTQVDLPRGKRSALLDVQSILAGLPDIAFVLFSAQDVVRHDLVRRIVSAYGAWEARQA
ncbi:MAG: PhoH family protein [Candidatus Sericytochromatia bacterium]|nr:PhoH family protein [Candidatus Sericytochromatia bacterium]